MTLDDFLQYGSLGFGFSEIEFKEKTKQLNTVLGKSLLLKLQYVTTVVGRLVVQLESVDQSLNSKAIRLLMQATKEHGTVSNALKKCLMRLNQTLQQTKQAIRQYEQLRMYQQSEIFEATAHRQKITNSLAKACEPILVCCLVSCMIFFSVDVFSAQNM